MRRIFVAGNPLVEEDSLALKVAEELRKEFKDINFQKIDSLSSLEKTPPNLYILDVAEGLQRVEKITDLEELQEIKLVSLHDFDLGTELLLLKKIGKIEGATIIAIPLGYPLEKAVSESGRILREEKQGN